MELIQPWVSSTKFWAFFKFENGFYLDPTTNVPQWKTKSPIDDLIVFTIVQQGPEGSDFQDPHPPQPKELQP